MLSENKRKVTATFCLVVFCASCLLTWKLYLLLSEELTLIYMQNENTNFEQITNKMTDGFWRLSAPINKTKKVKLDETFIKFWKKQRIPVKRWRGDGKCGYYSLLDPVQHSSWPRVGSWCDPESDYPCCNNNMNGTCSKVSHETCNCLQCVDSRPFKHAEISEWVTNDPSFTWNKYFGADACQVIEQSPYKDIYFIGDSFMRNMYTVLLMILAKDFQKGAWTIDMTDQQRKLCVGMETLFWTACRPMAVSVERLLHRRGRLCEGKRSSFNVSFKMWPNYRIALKFVNLVRNLSGKRGSLLLLGVGYHDGSKSKLILDNFVRPAMQAVSRFYRNTNTSFNDRWPRIIFVFPMPQGLLKPAEHFYLQNNQQIDVFCKEMQAYLRSVDVPILDFRNLAKNVHSFDGTHYGLAVNIMKNQVLLNGLTSFPTELKHFGTSSIKIPSTFRLCSLILGLSCIGSFCLFVKNLCNFDGRL